MSSMPVFGKYCASVTLTMKALGTSMLEVLTLAVLCDSPLRKHSKIHSTRSLVSQPTAPNSEVPKQVSGGLGQPRVFPSLLVSCACPLYFPVLSPFPLGFGRSLSWLWALPGACPQQALGEAYCQPLFYLLILNLMSLRIKHTRHLLVCCVNCHNLAESIKVFPLCGFNTSHLPIIPPCLSSAAIYPSYTLSLNGTQRLWLLWGLCRPIDPC